jgi:hypothetical protein
VRDDAVVKVVDNSAAEELRELQQSRLVLAAQPRPNEHELRTVAAGTRSDSDSDSDRDIGAERWGGTRDATRRIVRRVSHTSFLCDGGT